jgi:hypothetical protein
MPLNVVHTRSKTHFNEDQGNVHVNMIKTHENQSYGPNNDNYLKKSQTNEPSFTLFQRINPNSKPKTHFNGYLTNETHFSKIQNLKDMKTYTD